MQSCVGVKIHWEIPSIQSKMEGVDWIFWFSGVIAILMFTPFYLAMLCAVSLLPTFIRHYLLGHEPKEKFQNIILKSKFFYIGIALLIAFFVGMYNSTTYVKTADTIRIKLSKHQLYYSIRNQNQEVLDRKRLEGLEFWIDLFIGNPLSVWDRLVEFSQSNNIELEVDFSQVNKIRSHGQKIVFSKREAGKKEDNFETFTFDLSGIDPSVFQYINYQIQELSGIRR